MKLKDKKIELMENQVEVDKYGHHTNKLVLLATVWAYVRDLSGEEVYRAAQTNAEETKLFVINWRPGITSTGNAIRYKGEAWNITRIDGYEGYKADLRLYAKKARA